MTICMILSLVVTSLLTAHTFCLGFSPPTEVQAELGTSCGSACSGQPSPAQAASGRSGLLLSGASRALRPTARQCRNINGKMTKIREKASKFAELARPLLEVCRCYVDRSRPTPLAIFGLQEQAVGQLTAWTGDINRENLVK